MSMHMSITHVLTHTLRHMHTYTHANSHKHALKTRTHVQARTNYTRAHAHTMNKADRKTLAPLGRQASRDPGGGGTQWERMRGLREAVGKEVGPEGGRV